MEIISFLQELGDWLLPVMAFFTSLGYETFYILVIPLFYWCLDSAFGIRLALMLIFTGSLNELLKLTFHAPRPFWISTDISVSHPETNFAFPSGHAQNAASIWGLLADSLGKRWGWAAGALVAFFIGISRLYLGVHFPRDVLAGWLIGALILWLFLYLEAPLSNWIKRQSRRMQLAVSLAISFAIVLIGNLILWSLRDWSIPLAWLETAARHAAPAPDPLSRDGVTTLAGLFLGLAIGLILIQEKGGFNAKGPLKNRILRYLLGMAGTVILWAGLDSILPSGQTLLPQLGRYIRYALVGFWVTGAAPLCFRALKILSPRKQKTTSPQ